MFHTLMRMLFLEMVEIFLLTSWETFLILSLVSLIAALDRFLARPGPRSRHESGCSRLGDIAEVELEEGGRVVDCLRDLARP